MKKTVKRSVDFKFVAILMAAVAVSAVGIHFLHAFQVERNASSLRTYAENAEKDGNLGKAVDFLSRYINFVPDDTEALAKYGVLLDELGKESKAPRTRLRAFWILDQALRRDPDRKDLRERQVELAMYVGDFSTARDHLTVLLKASPNNAELKGKMGECEIGRKRYQEAAAWFKKAATDAPQKIEYYERQAYILRSALENNVAGDEVIRKMTEINDSLEAHLASARYWLTFESDDSKEAAAAIDKAEAALKKAEGKGEAESNPAVLLMGAQLAQVKDDPKKARQLLRKGIELHPKNASMYLALVSLELREGKLDDALKITRQGRKQIPDQVELLHSQADVLTSQGKLDEAEEMLQQLPKTRDWGIRKQYLSARIEFQKRDWVDAEKILRQLHSNMVRTHPLADQINLLLGSCYEKLSNPDLALLRFMEAKKIEPRSIRARMGLATAYSQLNRLEDAAREYRQILSIQGGAVGARLALARILITQNLRLPIQKQDWTEINTHLDIAAKQLPERVEIPIMQADVHFRNKLKELSGTPEEVVGKARESASLFLQVAFPKVESRPVEVWIALANLKRSDLKEAVNVLDDAVKHQPTLKDDSDLLLARLRILSRDEKNAVANLAQWEKSIRGFDAKKRQRLLAGLASAYYRADAKDKAKQIWNNLSEAQPENLGLHLLLFDLAVRDDDTGEMKQLLEKIKKIEGKTGTFWRYAEGVLAIHRARAEKEKLSETALWRMLGTSRKYLSELRKLRPSWYRVPALEAQVDELQDRTNRAIEHYQEAMKLGDRRPIIIRRLVALLMKERRFKDAGLAVRELLNDDANNTLLSAGLGKLATLSLLGEEKEERALDFALKSVAPDSKNYRDHLWLGQVLWNLGENKKAKQALIKARDLSPETPETWTALIVFLAKTDQTEEAKTNLQRAVMKISGDKAVLALAECHEAVGNAEKAEDLFKTDLNVDRKDPRRLRNLSAFYVRNNQLQEAEPLLRKILTTTGESAKSYYHKWARRALAGVLPAVGGYKNLQEALALLDKNLTDYGNDVADLRIKARLLAGHPAHHDEAIRVFQEVSNKQPLTHEESFALARLYIRTDNWRKAEFTLLALLGSADGKKPLYYAYYARRLLTKGETSQARSWAAQLQKLAPNSFVTYEIQARVLQAQAKDRQAVQLLAQYAKQKKANLSLTARLLEQLGHKSKNKKVYHDQAENLYQNLMEQSKDLSGTLALAGFLVRQKRASDAIALSEKAVPKAEPAQVAQFALTILSAGEAKYHKRINEWLTDAMKKEPTSPSLLLAKSDLYFQQERYAEAASAYRQLLKKTPDNVLALNNLAWLLAVKEKQPNEALKMIEKAFAVVGPTADLLDTRATVYMRLDRGKDAVADLQKAIDMDASPDKYFHLALAQLLVQDRNAARTAFQRAKADGLTAEMILPLERPEFLRLEATFN